MGRARFALLIGFLRARVVHAHPDPAGFEPPRRAPDASPTR